MIRDVGSAGGTYVRVMFGQRKELSLGMLLMIGKHQFYVSSLNDSETTVSVTKAEDKRLSVGFDTECEDALDGPSGPHGGDHRLSLQSCRTTSDRTNRVMTAGSLDDYDFCGEGEEEEAGGGSGEAYEASEAHINTTVETSANALQDNDGCASHANVYLSLTHLNVTVDDKPHHSPDLAHPTSIHGERKSIIHTHAPAHTATGAKAGTGSGSSSSGDATAVPTCTLTCFLPEGSPLFGRHTYTCMRLHVYHTYASTTSTSTVIPSQIYILYLFVPCICIYR